MLDDPDGARMTAERFFTLNRSLQAFRSPWRALLMALAGATVVVGAALQVAAATTFYTSQSSFEAAASPLAVENFVMNTSGLVMLPSPLGTSSR